MRLNEEGFKWRRAWAISQKEVSHIVRDAFTLALALVLPLVIVLIFGYAIEFNLSEIPTSYIDSDRTQSSRSLIETFGSSNYFKMFPVEGPAQGWWSLETEKARAVVIIPPGFEKDLMSGRGTDVQVLVDGADNTAAGSIMSYLGEIQSRAQRRALSQQPVEPVRLKTRFLFNPELNSKWFIVPGLVVVFMSILAVLLTALTVAREWETGSMELLLSTPVLPLEIILGKIAPYAGLCLIAVAMIYVLARILFGVPFVGSHFVFLLGCVLALVAYLAQGLLISVVTRKQTLAMQAAMLSGLLPSQLLSGFIFPIESMPTFFQYLTMLLPARWFMTITRDSFLQGATLWDLRSSFFALTLIGGTFIVLAVRRFKKDLEP